MINEDTVYLTTTIYLASTVLQLAVVVWSVAQVKFYQQAIRRHRDCRGDDRCWRDDFELYQTLPEGYRAPPHDTRVELEMCQQYIACRHNPETEYTSPQRRIEQLEALVESLSRRLAAQSDLLARKAEGEDVLPDPDYS